jgi:LCP family protein required for cell wall assembly
MRTTLKRGLGRGATLNGNGHRAVYPPGVLTPMRRYRVPPPPERTTRQLVGWLFRWTLAGLLMVVAGLGGGLYLYQHQTLASFAPHSAGVKRAQELLSQKVPDASQPAVGLVIGYDKRAGADAAGGSSRSDTIMLVRADPIGKSISLMSFPRDLLVPVRCPKQSDVIDRINSAWARCGAAGTVLTVEALTGITPDYLITVNFHGFKLLVNKVGGVNIDVDHRYLNTQGGPGGYAKIDLQPGYQKLDGQQSLDFVRFRHTDSDLYRLARQQLFVTALRERIASSFSIFSVFKIVGALKGNVEIANGGGGAVPADVALSYLKFMHGLPSGHFVRANIDRSGLAGYDTLSATQSAVQAAVATFQHPDVTAPQQAHNAALGVKPKPTARTLRPAQITTLVLNGTTIPGLARDTSFKLAVRGYHTVQLGGQQPANAPSQGYFPTNVYYDPAQTDAKVAARDLQKVFKGAIVGPLPAEVVPLSQSAGNPLTVVVLGSSFDGQLQDQAATTQVPLKHQKALVVSSPGTTLQPLRDVRGRVPFPIMVPHVLEEHSHLAQLTPVRVYKPVAHREALRMTFVTGAGNVYWGIEETNWNDAPVLGHPTVSHTFGGRKFDFYYTSTHLHMVVLRAGPATYWVVNTLLDELSNETMIAIARGLRPLGQ